MRTHPQRPHARSAPPFSLGRQIHRRLPHRAKACAHGIPRWLQGGSGAHTPAARPHTGPLTGHAHTPAAPARPHTCTHAIGAAFCPSSRPVEPARTRARSRAPAIAAGHPPRRPDGPNRSAALPKSPFGRRARGFFFFFAVSSLLCFLLYPLFFENIRRPPLASKFVGRPLRTPLAAPRLPASLPSAPLVPRPAPAPHPAPPRSPPRPFPLPHPAPSPHPGLSHPRTPTPFSPQAHKKGARIVSDACALFSLCSKSRPMSRPFKRGAFPRA